MSSFRLKVQKIEQTCLFELSWGKGQQISCILNYPQLLTELYQEWQRIYLSFYKSALRGRLEGIGGIAPPPIDWHAKLVQAEAKFLYEFHYWLHGAELFEIRRTIANSHWLLINTQKKANSAVPTVNVFLTCEPLELARLPWEAWEIGAEFPNDRKRIRIIRIPKNIRQENNQNSSFISRRKKARILAILGDDTGLNFHADKEAVTRCSQVAEIEFIGWQPGSSIPELKASICAALADERGWDVLFFAGHSNETQLTGGEVGIAPNVSLSISEITPYLEVAKKNGLQFALFNSCSGINIAEFLIDLGLSQVIVMREPVHNAVAQAFLVKFLQVLAEHHDVQEAMLAACQYLKLEHSLSYPSASLIPSLFCHSEAVLFRISPSGWKQRIKQIKPTKIEAIMLVTLALVSLFHPVHDFLLDKRLFGQAIYRQFTAQVPRNPHPPVLLVQIDEESIRHAKIADPKPMNRVYLAELVDKLSALNAKVVGFDYLLDRPLGKSDRILSQSLQSAVKKQSNPPWFVFASVQNHDLKWLTILPEIASPNWSLHGYINLAHWYVEQIPQNDSTNSELPFSYILALAHQVNIKGLNSFDERQKLVNSKFNNNGKVPNLNSRTKFFLELNQYIEASTGKSHQDLFSPRAQFKTLTQLSYNFGQMWGQPILDFSIPPELVYQSIPAWQLLEATTNYSQLPYIQQQVVIVAPGGYGEAGVFQEGQDNYPMPNAISYWLKTKQQNGRRSFTGGEAHAYMVHHFIESWLVIPIPDLWMIGVAALLGKAILLTNLKPFKRKVVLLSGIAVYGVVCLQVYVTGAVLLPWVLPSVMIASCALPTGIRRKHYEFS